MWNLAFLILGIIVGIFLALDYKMLKIGKYGHFQQHEFKGNWVMGLRSKMMDSETKQKIQEDVYFSAPIYRPEGVYVKKIISKNIK
jgi:hypothetical protein